MSLVFLAGLLGGCAGYDLVPAGPVNIGDLQLAPAAAWSQAPAELMPGARQDSVVWTRDGLGLNRFVIIPAVPDGEALFDAGKSDVGLPVFQSGMLPGELEELVRASVVQLMGEGKAAVSASNLRPHRYGPYSGVLLDLDAALSDGPDCRGMAGAFVASGRLYVILYLAATPLYYDRYLAEAETMIASARVPVTWRGAGLR